jgi:thioesterase domain-containing protein
MSVEQLEQTVLSLSREERRHFLDWLYEHEAELIGPDDDIDADQVALLAQALSDDPQDQFEIYKAHLQDELGARGTELVQIHFAGVRSLKDKPRHRTAAEKALAWLSKEIIRNKDMKEWLIDFHKLFGSPEP